MKISINFYAQFILLFLLSTFILAAEDSCPSGMRRTYVDDQSMTQYGSARAWYGAVCYFQWPGSLFFSRKVLIEPRFEVHLKAELERVDTVESNNEQKVYGFTIVISGYKNTISGYVGRNAEISKFDDIGYNNFINSLIVGFDFERDLNDPDDSSFSIRYCDKFCSADDKYSYYHGYLPNQKYNYFADNHWDFRLVYDNKRIKILSGATDVLFIKDFDLEGTLGTNIGFVGFTGFTYSNRREINLLGSFMCEDNYDITKMPGNFYIEQVKLETATYEAGADITYLFSFINNRNQVIPHTYGYNIWNYTFGITHDCGETSYSITKETNYTLILKTKACSTIGKHSINIFEQKKGNAPQRYYTVVAGAVSKIILIGHDGIIATVPNKTIADIIYLTYGNGLSGDFIYKKNLQLVLDFNVTDQNGNLVDLPSPNSVFTLKKVNSLGEILAVTSNIISYTMKKVDNHYQMTILVNKIGTYQIEKNSYMAEGIRFSVTPGEISFDKSFCTLDGYTSVPTLEKDTKVKYNCYFRDSDGNEITTENFFSNSIYDFMCSVQGGSSKSSSSTTFSGSDKETYFSCEYSASLTGTYTIDGLLTKKGTTDSKKISSKINQFIVKGTASSLTLKNVFDVYTKNWLEIDGSSITYSYDKDGFITAVDLAEEDGLTLISSYGKYPVDFDVSTLKAELYSEHDLSYKFGELKTMILNMNGIEYIGVFTKDGKPTDSLIKKSSFDYKIRFTLEKINGKEIKVVTLKYIININPYTTCFHDLSIKNTNLDIPWRVELITGGAERKISKVELRTMDYYLYNYDIGKEKVQFLLTPEAAGITFRVVPLLIEGTYDVYAKSTQDYSGKLHIKIKGEEVRQLDIISKQPEACFMEFEKPELFKYLYSQHVNHFYEYTGDFVEGNLLFRFRIKDIYNNTVYKDDYFETKADIYCLQYGNNDYKLFNLTYNKETGYFEFRDKLPFESRQYTWVFFMREGTCNTKYYITYDGARKNDAPMSTDYSRYNLLNLEIKNGEYAYVEVIYKDINGQFLGLQKGKLEEIKSKTVVKAINTEKKVEIIFEFDSITSNYAIKYKYKFKVSGTYKVKATSDGNALKCGTSDTLTVIDMTYSLNHSLLQLILDTIIEMKTNVRVTIDNTVQRPVYNLIFYTAGGLKTTYDQKIEFKCKMTGQGVTLDLNVTKKTDEVQFTHKDNDMEQFKALKGGDYKLIVSDDKGSIEYPLYLTGDGNTDYSNDKDYDITQTEVNPTHIDGIAGVTYTINVEFRAKDGLRWNYEVDLTKFSVSNSYGLSGDKFTSKLVNGYKKGQVIIYVTQTVVTTKNDNILSFTYNSKKIPKNVSLTIKCGDLAKLIYVDGPTDGNVINPPILTFKPVDKYDNLYTGLFNSSSTKEFLDSLTIGKSFDGVSLTTHNYVAENQYLKVQYLSTISTNVRVTSKYFEENYDYRIKSGPIDPETSFAELISKGEKVGSQSNIMIYPKDKYKNDIDDLGIEDMKKFLTYYQINDADKTNVTQCKLIEDTQEKSSAISKYKSIECTTSITNTGEIEFHVDYVKDEIECRNCEFSIFSNEADFSNTKTFYKNREYYLKTDEKNEVEAKKEPTFELTFFDKYKNQMSSQVVEKLNVSVILDGIDIKLCVSNSGDKKIVNLCPASNGDDNINKWQYLTNGDNYKLIVQDKDNVSNKLVYPLKITGGASDGSSGETDFSKTNFNPTKILIKAGEEGKTTMELRTGENLRKNYWYPNPTEKIAVDFLKDKDTCSYKVEKGELPGQYAIKVTCTKTNDANSFTVTVDGNKIDQKIDLIVVSNRAYYLEVEDKTKFTVSGDKYTWKTNPTNDEEINFNFKLKDKYLNYITTSVIGKNEITISSETYGENEKYYKLDWNDNKKDYLFTDGITVIVTKHVWNIVCVESNRKYSFIYTKIPGEVDISKSYWTIDKTDYIIKETSIVLVTLVDRLGVNIGTVEGRLLKEKDSVKVVTTKDKDILYSYNSNTNDFSLKYNYQYKEIGKYNVSVSYKGKEIKPYVVEVSVSYEKVNLKTSKLFYDKGDGKENLMSTTVQTNINNLEYTPFYKFYLYTADGKKITLFDRSKKVTCFMTYEGESWELDVDLNKGEYIHFAYKDGNPIFNKLPMGLYSLDITYDGELIKYPIYLLGEKDVSPSSNYDITKIYIKPIYISGVAGEQYEIEIEFRAKDGLRWNYEINLNSLTVSNSYGLNDTQFKYDKKLGEKNGQVKLYVTQYLASYGDKDNILTLGYDAKDIPQTVTLHIKNAELFKLEYVGGAVDGTVINPSIVQFTPKDKFGNIFMDLFDEIKYPKSKLEMLTSAISVEGYNLSTNNWVSDNKYLNVQYGSTKVTTIKLTPKYNGNTYTYKLWSGPIDPEHSYAEVEKTEGVKAGDITTVNIYPKDLFGNDVTNVTTEDLSKFDVDYEVDKENKVDISKECDINKITDHFSCYTNITKAGEVEVTVDYDDKDVTCKKCEFVVSPDEIDFDKTKVFNKNEEKEMSRIELNTLPVNILPNFLLTFFDRFMNPIINKTEVELLQITTDIIITDVKLCVTNKDVNKLSNVCKSINGDENEKKWQYLPNGDKYKLVVTKIATKKELTFPVKLIGGYSDGDSGPIDCSKTYLNPTELTLVAGEEGSVFMELRTKDEKRKNYWYDKPDDNINIKFPEDVKKCTYSLSQGEKPGQYYIKFICTQKKDAFKTTVLVEGKEVPKQITITVIPGAPAKSRLFRMTGEEIKESKLGSVSVEDKFQMINKLYDKYDNLITNIDFPLSNLQIKMVPSVTVKIYSYSAEPVSHTNGDIIITLKSTYAGLHNVTGLYFPLNLYTITFTHGEPDADNSIIEVSHTERYVGEEVKVYITPYDKFNNYIDANEYKETSPYQVKYSNEGENEKKVFTEKYSIEVKDGLKVLSYPGAFFIKGTTIVFGFIDNQQIKCVSCRVNIKAKDLYFPNSNVLRLESSKNIFETLKNGTVEHNTKEEPVYRLYPRDKYENDIDIIPEEKLKTYYAYFKSQNTSTLYKLKLNNKEFVNQSYAEFVINDIPGETVTWATLVGGYYDLVFTDGIDKLTYNITLAGDGQGGSNEPADYQNTHINDQNLKFIAGKYGYMLIEIRTKDNIRKNFWEGYKFTIKSCNESDKTFKYTQANAGTLGVFYITVTTEKANTYPKLERCPLKVYVNDELVKDLNPEMEVSPDEVVTTKILEKYYKDGKNSSVLVDGNADIPYVFEVASYDQYGNLAETLQEVVGIKVSYKGDEIKKTTSETNTTTGFRKYTVPATKAGTYVVNTDKSGPKGLYLPNESIFTIHPGKIDLSKTIVKEKDTPIPAGSHPAVSIEAFDQYDNALYINDYKDKFNSTFIDAGNKEHSSTSEYSQLFEKVFYTSDTPVTIVGNVRVTVVYDQKEKVDTSKVIILVIPGDPDPNNSILSREITKGIFNQYKNGDNFTVDTNEVLLLNVTLYDKYNNYISNIPADANVLKPVMYGNSMDEIIFTVIKNPGYFGLDFNENATYIHTYQHLVSGIYDFTYTVKTVLGEANFKYHIIVSKDDKGHGNGPYVLEKCVLKPKNVSFVAGNYEHFTLELRTKESLLYNDDIDISNDIDIKIDKEDKSFKSTITKSGSEYGIYTITIYSEKKGYYKMDVLLADPTKERGEKGNVGPAYYTVYPDKVPDKRFTVFFSNPNNTEVNVDTTLNISFTLADKFNNLFEGRHDCVDEPYLTLLNNEEPLEVISFTLKPDEKTYEVILKPKYPPRTMSMNVLYNDGENKVLCFPGNIDVKIFADIDYLQTQIVSSNKELIKVGEILDMWLYTFDKKGECFNEDYSKQFEIVVTGPLNNTKEFIKKYKVKKIEHDSECNNEYQIITTEDDKYTIAGNYLIEVFGNGSLIAKYDQVCLPLGYSMLGFLLDYDFDPDHISILDNVQFTISGEDMYGNKLEEPLYDDITIKFTKDGNNTPFESDKLELKKGNLQFDVGIRIVGPHQLHIYYKGEEVKTVNHGEKIPIFTILPGPCRAENNEHFDLTPTKTAIVNVKTYFSFQCYDVYGNKITKGGEDFSVNGKIILKEVDNTKVDAEIIDNNDGTYNVEFIPIMHGTYVFDLKVDKENYGEPVKVEISPLSCSGKTSVLCPNVNKCVSNIQECIVPPNNCSIEKPFECKVNGVTTCVKSQIDCDCPPGFIRCEIMRYCVPENRPDMCPAFKKPFNYCSRFGDGYEMNYDGICRPKGSHGPNQRVCPIGQVLCADLSCRDSYYDCVVTEEREPTKVRCVGQKIVTADNLCPSSFVCEKKDDVACPDGSCVSNEIYCRALPQCTSEAPYRCQNNICSTEFIKCTESTSCGQLKSLCSDNICRDSCVE